MATFLTLALFILGLLVIIKGGDWFVEAAVWIAKITGIPSIFIGATIVSVATTLPELLVSTIATYQHYYDVALGNVVGSLVCNIGLILGLTAVISPIKMSRKSFTIKSVIMLLCGFLILFFATDKLISLYEGTILLIIFAIYIIYNIMELKLGGNKKEHYEGETIEYSRRHTTGYILKFIFGAVFIVVGARLLVDNGVALANIIGIPEQIVSLTLIALGTSLPELITAMTSIAKGHHGISVGNIIGANILNMLMVIGTCARISSGGLVISYQNVMLGATIYNVPQTLYLDLPVSLVLMLILVIGGSITGKISRALGFTMLAIYGVYLFTLVKLFL